MKQTKGKEAEREIQLSVASKQAIETAMSALVVDLAPTIIPSAFQQRQFLNLDNEHKDKT